MSEKASKIAILEREIERLKTEEARFRYLASSVKTSPEYRKEALAELDDVRRRIYQLSCDITELKRVEE